LGKRKQTQMAGKAPENIIDCLTSTKRIRVGDWLFDAAGLIFMKDRDRILDAMTNGWAVTPETRIISFGDPESVAKCQLAGAAGLDLLMIALSDGSARYLLADAKHLEFAEEITKVLDQELLARMPSIKKLQ
jgi:hypothetical protein